MNMMMFMVVVKINCYYILFYADPSYCDHMGKLHLVSKTNNVQANIHTDMAALHTSSVNQE